jgi:hypothetical protein
VSLQSLAHVFARADVASPSFITFQDIHIEHMR